MAGKKTSKQKKSATKASKKATKKSSKKTVKLDASDQIYNFLDKLVDEASNAVMKKEGTVADFVDSAVDIYLSALNHSLFNLRFYGGTTEIISDHVKAMLADFDSDKDFPAWDDNLECECGDICNECAKKMEEEASEKSKSALN